MLIGLADLVKERKLSKILINRRIPNIYYYIQGRRRVFKSGPAEEIIECRRHEWGRAREGDSPSR